MPYLILLVLLSCFSFSNNLINVNFKDLELKELIKITSQTLDKNILVTQNIKGKVDFISNEPINKSKLLDILKYSLEANSYKLIEKDNILKIVKNDFKEEIVEEISTASPIQVVKYVTSENVDETPLVNHTEIILLKNIDAKRAEQILKSIVSQREYGSKIKPSISIDEEFNSIILDGSFDELNSLKNILLNLDIAKQQVYVKAMILEIDDSLVEDIGIKYGILGGKIHSGGLYTFSSSLNDGNAIAIDTGSVGLEIPNVSSTLALGATLSLLNRTYALDVISQPSILCLDNKESFIYVGETVSIQTGSTTTDGGNTKITYEREDIGLTLKVKPRISNDNRVSIQINTILEGVKNTDATSLNPNTSKKEVKTTAIVNNGESVIIGGLVENKKQNSIQKIPLAGDIPLIGDLFKNRLTNNQNKNLVVIVTPYIIPKNRDLTYVRNQLSKLKSLEDKFLENVLINLRAKKDKSIEEKVQKQNLINEELHKKRVEEYFGI